MRAAFLYPRVRTGSKAASERMCHNILQTQKDYGWQTSRGQAFMLFWLEFSYTSKYEIRITR